MIITPEYLTSLGYTTKSVPKDSHWMPIYFSKKRDFYFMIDFKYGYIRLTIFVDDRSKEVFEGYVADVEEFEKIINQFT